MMIIINGILNYFSFSWEWKSTYTSTVPWSQKNNLQWSPSTQDLKDPACQGAGISIAAPEALTSMSASSNSFLGVVRGRSKHCVAVELMPSNEKGSSWRTQAELSCLWM